MFSLIITLVSIVIVGALILAVVYYGGSAFTGSGTKALAAACLPTSESLA